MGASAMFTMWQIMTFDSWASKIAREIIFTKGHSWAAVFFISYIYAVGIIMVNVVATSLLEKFLQTTKNGPSIIEGKLRFMKKDAVIELITAVIDSAEFFEVPTDELATLADILSENLHTRLLIIKIIKDPNYGFHVLSKKNTRSALIQLLLAEQIREDRRRRMLLMHSKKKSLARSRRCLNLLSVMEVEKQSAERKKLLKK